MARNARREARADTLEVVPVEADGVLHLHVVDLGSVEQPAYCGIVRVRSGGTPRGFAAPLGNHPTIGRASQLLDIARVAHIELPGTLTLEVMCEHGVAVDGRGVPVDRDQLVAEHVHRHLEVRDAADVVDQLGTIRERVRTPSFDPHVGREARFDHGEVTPVDTAR